MTKIKTPFLCFLTLFVLEAAMAEKVFTWVDEKGVTHYSDRPSDNGENTEVIVSVDDPRDESADTAQSENQQSTLDEESSQSSDTQDQETIAYCNQLKKNLRALEANVRVKLTHEDGKVEYLAGEGKEREKQRVLKLMSEFCQ